MRIFVFGKVYDLDNQPIVDIEKDTAKRVTDFTMVDNGVRIYQDAGEIEVIFYRGINFNTDDDVLFEQDTWLISGEGTNPLCQPTAHLPVSAILWMRITTLTSTIFVTYTKRMQSFMVLTR